MATALPQNRVTPRSLLWLVLNAAGIAFWLKLATRVWAQPGGENCDAEFANGLYVVLELAPLYLMGAVASFVAAAVSVTRFKRSRNAPGMLVLLCVFVAWAGAAATFYYGGFLAFAGNCPTTLPTPT